MMIIIYADDCNHWNNRSFTLFLKSNPVFYFSNTIFMGKNKNTAIYFCRLINGNSELLNISELAGYSINLDPVQVVWNCDDIPLLDAKYLSELIKQSRIERIIIVGNAPGIYRTFFSRAMLLAGGSPDQIEIFDLKAKGVDHSSGLPLAKAILACMVYQMPEEDLLTEIKEGIEPDTMIIGGGIAGIQAALEIANADLKVHLVEKTGTIGGHMAMFDKTFPTLDCAACILTPKMVEVGQHPNINLLTYSEVVDVQGEPGNYRVNVLKKARRVNPATCIGCGTCAEKCPSKVVSEFDAGTTLRKAAYIPFPQAVPNKYLIDAAHCTYVQTGKCGVCVRVCPVPDCINLDAEDEIIELNVGNIIVATGFKTFDATRIEEFGYGTFPNVITSLELERLVNASGPTGGKITLRSEDKKGNRIFTPEGPVPGNMAIIHCVGSRDENYNRYCSRVCCMYSLKLAHLVREKLPDTDIYEYYIDMRAFGKGYEEFYERIKNEGIHIIRGRTAKVMQKNGKLALRSEDIEGGKVMEQEVDMVVLAVGLEPADDTPGLVKMLNISCDENGWLKEKEYTVNPVETMNGGVTIAGVCQGPKDIPDTVAQASAAASKVIQNILNNRIQTTHLPPEHEIEELLKEKLLFVEE